MNQVKAYPIMLTQVIQLLVLMVYMDSTGTNNVAIGYNSGESIRC